MKRKLTTLIAAVCLVACGTQIRGVSATDSEGGQYAVCFKVVQRITPISTRLVFMGCANTEQDIAAVEDHAKSIAAITPNSEVRKVPAK